MSPASVLLHWWRPFPTLAEGEKGENETQTTVDTKMDGAKWKRWSDGEANCQSVRLRKRGEMRPLEMSAVMKTGGLICNSSREVERNFAIDLKEKSHVETSLKDTLVSHD